MTTDESMDLDDARRMTDIWFDQVSPALNKANDLAAQVAACVEDYNAGGSTWLADNVQEFVKALDAARQLMYEIDNDIIIDEIDLLKMRIKRLEASIAVVKSAHPSIMWEAA